MGKTIDIGGRIHNPEVGNVVTGANEILDDTKNKKQDVINGEVDAALEALDANKQDNLTFDQTPTEDSTNPVTSGGVYAADLALQQAIEAILTLIPSAASALNQLADKSFVNSSIATASATFRGTYNLVSDLHLSVTASHQDIATALASVVSTADNNDYCFVQIPTSDTSSDIRVTERYKFNGTAWAYEYDLNNSGFTATQWEAINSGITALLVTKLGALPTAAELATSLAGKQNMLTFDNVPVTGSDNPVKSGGLYQLFTAIDAKFPSDASSSNKLVAENRLTAYVTAVIEALDASFNLTSADGHITFRMTQTNGVIASVQILTSDIASASALTTLGGQVSTNASDIAALQALYNALQQSAPQIIQPSDTWPVANPSTTVIYRVIDRVNTPPQFYSDYMWDGTTWVLMATYNNAIDNYPTPFSNNLVKSGGVYSAINSFVKKDNSVADFNIGDEDGNVLMQLEGGDIRTKEFNSRRAVTRKNDDSDAQLNLGDEEGNVLLQLKNGHIKTKYFDSENIDRSSVGLLQRFTLPTVPAQNGTDTDHQFFNLAQGNPQAQWVYDWYTPLIARSGGYITKEILGKDSSGLYDIWRLTLQPKYTISHNGQYAPVGTYPLKTSRKVVMVANIHGDPYDPIDAAFTLFWLCKFLVDEYETNEVARYLRDNYTFIIIPIGNPWGMDNRSYGTYNGVQINRNYPYHFVANQQTDYGTTTGPYALSEKESQYINATLQANLDAYAYFDIHSFGTSVHTKTFYNPINDPFGFNKQRVLTVFNNTASLIDGVKLGMYDNCDFDGWGPGYVVHELGIWTPFLECNSFLDGVTGDEALQFSSGALTSNFYDLVGLLMFDK